MAEPLLKRTFSRLRGKEKYRRKTDPKLGEIHGKVDFLQSSSSSLSSSSSAVQAEPPQAVPVEDTSRRGTQITVAKKQNWAKLSSSSSSSSSRDPPSTEGPHGLGSRAHTWDSCSGKAQVSKQAWSQKTACEEGPESRRKDFERDPGVTAIPYEVPGTALPELTHPAAGYAEICASSSGEKLSGQGAYLQTLDRSSRAWVLSTGKSQAAEEASRSLPNCLAEWRPGGADRESNIWYNPIPEEEDPPRGGGGRGDYGNPWRKREADGSPENRRDPQSRTQRWAGLLGSSGSRLERHGSNAAQCMLGAPGTGSDAKEFAVESSATACKESPDLPQQAVQVESQQAGAVAGGNGAGAGPSDSPGSQKKGGGAGSSVIDRIKSPGTVRRLSLKMRKLPELRRKLSLRSSRTQRPGAGQTPAGDGSHGTSPSNSRKESSNNVISRYHLDTSAPARPLRRSSRGRSASKGGYLSDGDSPELLPKQGAAPSAETAATPAPPPHSGGEAVPDPAAFRPYCLSEQPRCAQRVSGLLMVHLMGAEEILKAPRADGGKEVFCAIQVDGLTRARTALLTCRGPSLPLNHTFNLELERARLLKLVLLTPHPNSSVSPSAAAPARNRVCGLGEVAIPPLFRSSRSQQLCVKLEPRGLLYVKLTLLEQWDPPSPSQSALQPASVFGVGLRRLVDKEGSALKVPLIIQKCVAEIEKRGLKVVGLYRLCGSAAVKKELRDAFERDSGAVALTEELYPDINVITGILKDYLRELPSPLITRTLYEVVLGAMTLRPPRAAPCGSNGEVQRSHSTVSLLECLPEPEKATLALLLDHLSLVASFSDSNRMTCQNLAVCFGPVLLTPTQESWRPRPPGAHAAGGAQRGGRSFTDSEEIASAVDFKRHIEALHYLLQLWPIPTGHATEEGLNPDSVSEQPPSPALRVSHNALQHRGQRLPLRLDLPQDVVVSRRGRGRLESPPCNRYAGDWSVCGRDFLSSAEADYDEVAGSDSEEEEAREPLKKSEWAPPGPLYVDEFALGPEALDLDLDAPFTCRLSLKDFDTLISDLERELSKQINICL
ncbi:rho GTPase-activating protein SYDE1 [Anguilla rostrata]|uniref:rho GTPase-activating protein SYDE1 n=1 Tax=Anguilla rostrata TaxID=7938 RepID=UPI0030CC4107